MPPLGLTSVLLPSDVPAAAVPPAGEGGGEAKVEEEQEGQAPRRFHSVTFPSECEGKSGNVQGFF